MESNWGVIWQCDVGAKLGEIVVQLSRVAALIPHRRQSVPSGSRLKLWRGSAKVE